MAFSYVEYTSQSGTDGGRTYTFAFDAVAKDTANVKVTIGGKHLYDGIRKYNTSTRLVDSSGSVQSAEYTVSDGSITILSSVSFTVGTSTVSSGVPTLSTAVPIRIFRLTNRDTAEVTFTSGSILSDTSLNKASDQARFLGLEAVDRAEESISIDSNDSTQYNIQVEGSDKRIFGVLDPQNANDVANRDYVDKATLGQLTNTTLTTPVFNTSVSGTAIKDEDDMSSNSATHLATQQSIKAYADTKIPSADLLDEDNMATDSATKVASQQSIKAYADTKIPSSDLVDEDNMSSNSATKVPSQQSVKAYVDTQDSTTASDALSNSIVFSIALG